MSGLRICGVCRGSGSLLSTRWGLRWWACPCCGGDGVEAMRQPKIFTRAALPSHKGAGAAPQCKICGGSSFCECLLGVLVDDEQPAKGAGE